MGAALFTAATHLELLAYLADKAWGAVVSFSNQGKGIRILPPTLAQKVLATEVSCAHAVPSAVTRTTNIASGMEEHGHVCSVRACMTALRGSLSPPVQLSLELPASSFIRGFVECTR